MKTESNQPLYIGIDVSKLTLDICVLADGQGRHSEIKNTPAAIRAWFKRLAKEEGASHLCVGIENTGRYNYALYEVLAAMPHTVFVLNPLHLKKSMGLVRGKSDRIDAARIAAFVQAHRTTLVPWVPKRDVLVQLQWMLTRRTQLVKLKKQLTVAARERVMLADKALRTILDDQDLLRNIKQKIKALEAHIATLVRQDETLSRQAACIGSVPGAGKVITWHLLVKTNEFKTLNDPRKLACYAGVAPFEYRSGTSVKGRPGVSMYADKRLKTLFHLGAMSAIRLPGELRDFYQRKIEAGKNKMSVLNAVRNKIIHRICAAVRNEKFYNPNLNNLVMS